ncbi:flagellin FliC [Achromobacter marplatensis]|uniref:Flagellin n=1 Tax=Achromobacter marplatensis TaxID=470868 RepID=A0ABX9GJC8_9BURK|nr:flagellin [Achromobacter marplatensis]OWT69658.1 flagellin FliC [Achromobacter marplatensis]RBP23645.1 flagellin [Achromobacter marplatensis]CAB3630862.1 Flagellin [Achromobacter marplatensis]
MAAVINTNYLSLVAQNNLNKSQSTLGTAIERLSSGLRINSAKDDAAGQAIANRFTANVNGLNQAARNANDGISIAQTTEGALNEINNNLQRIRQLSVQASTGTNSTSDLDSIQAEIQQRLEEIDRVSDQTQFNGVRVLAADNTLKIQVGANDNETISIDLKSITKQSLGLGNFTVSGDRTATMDDMVKSFGATGYSTFTVDIDGAAATGVKVDANSGKVTTSADAQLYVSATTNKITASNTNNAVTGAGAVADAFGTAFDGKAQGDTATIGGASWERVTTGTSAEGEGTYRATINGAQVEVTITGGTSGTGGTLAVSSGSLYMDDAAYVGGTTKFTNHQTNEKATVASLESAGAVKTGGKLEIGTTGDYTVDANGVVTDDNAANRVMYIQNAGKANEKLIDSSTAQIASRNPLEKIDAALANVDALRSDLGAVQNRFESTVANLNNTVNNLSAARSRIEDADYATEVSNMTKAQILQQAGTSVLAQANQVPQSVLSLLR